MAVGSDKIEQRLADVDDELVAMYVEDTQQEERIVRIFLCEDREPPRRERTLGRGFDAAEVDILTKYPRPQDADAEFTHTPPTVA